MGAVAALCTSIRGRRDGDGVVLLYYILNDNFLHLLVNTT